VEDVIVAIIVSRGGKDARKLVESEVEKEDFLQAYVADNPDSLPLDEIKEDLRLMFVGREFSTTSGRIDVLAVDRDGDLYVIETKLFKNPDKRLVVAQALDYGASLWRTYGDPREFTRALDGQFGFTERLKAHFGLDDGAADALIDAVERNLQEGPIKFVILMNRLDDRLRDLILYLNQKSNFTIYAVEMQFYRHDGLEIVIPHLFGAEASRVPKTGGVVRKAGVWDEPRFFEDAGRKLAPAEVNAIRRLYEFSTSHGVVSWGAGKVDGSISVVYPQLGEEPLYWVFSNGNLGLLFQRWNGTDRERSIRDQLKAGLEGIGFTPFPADYADRRIGKPVAEWGPKVEDLIRLLEGLLSNP
jgi:hypothetical protein